MDRNLHGIKVLFLAIGALAASCLAIPLPGLAETQESEECEAVAGAAFGAGKAAGPGAAESISQNTVATIALGAAGIAAGFVAAPEVIAIAVGGTAAGAAGAILWHKKTGTGAALK